MKLKIRIKEVETTERELTVEESAMVAIVKDSRYNDTYSARMEHKLKEIGFKETIEEYNIGNPLKMETAIFRKETIRDATEEEYIAWHCIDLRKHCKVLSNDDDCHNCPKSPPSRCYGTEDEKAAVQILKGKEVILEVVE